VAAPLGWRVAAGKGSGKSQGSGDCSPSQQRNLSRYQTKQPQRTAANRKKQATLLANDADAFVRTFEASDKSSLLAKVSPKGCHPICRTELGKSF